MTYLWVALGGAFGAAARFAVAQWTGARWGWTFPWGTLAVNLTGSLAIGLVMTILLARGADPAYRLLLVTGFLGGYTTFSAFSFEALALLEARRWDAAALYVGGSVMLGLLATALGLGLGRVIVRWCWGRVVTRSGSAPVRCGARRRSAAARRGVRSSAVLAMR